MLLCKTCGSILSPVVRVRHRGSQYDQEVCCNLCQEGGRVEEVELPYIFRYLVAQLAVLSIKIKIDVMEGWGVLSVFWLLEYTVWFCETYRPFEFRVLTFPWVWFQFQFEVWKQQNTFFLLYVCRHENKSLWLMFLQNSVCTQYSTLIGKTSIPSPLPLHTVVTLWILTTYYPFFFIFKKFWLH